MPTKTHRKKSRPALLQPLEQRILLSAVTTVIANISSAPLYNDLTITPDGTLYTTSQFGGALGKGQVVQIIPGRGDSVAIATFDGQNGAQPIGQMVADSAGNLFGVTASGGTNNDGTVFEILHDTTQLITLGSFNGTNGSTPSSNLILDSSDDVFGMTFSQAPNNNGMVFEIPHNGNITVLANLPANSGYPASLVMDPSGNLFGITANGGATGDGQIFEIAALNHTLSTLASFSGTNGSSPFDLVRASNGVVYGVTSTGGSANDGVVFKLAPAASNITPIFNFTQTGLFQSSLAIDSAGNIFGTTEFGGPNKTGTLFEIPAGTDTLSTAFTFGNDPAVGQAPISVTPDLHGNLFGISSQKNSPFITVYKLSNVSIAPPSPIGPPLVNNSPLIPAISGRLPSTPLVAGSAIKPFNQKILISDPAGSNITGNVMVSLLLSPDATGASGGVAITPVARSVNIKPGKAVSIPLTITSLPAGVTGPVFLIPFITDPNGHTAFAASAGSLTIDSPTLDFTPTLITVPNVKPGQPLQAKITVVNQGNTAFRGNLPIDLQASASGVIDLSSIDLGIASPTVSLLPGKKVTLTISKPFTVPAGSYFIIADVDPDDALGESVLANNALSTRIKIIHA